MSTHLLNYVQNLWPSVAINHEFSMDNAVIRRQPPAAPHAAVGRFSGHAAPEGEGVTPAGGGSEASFDYNADDRRTAFEQVLAL